MSISATNHTEIKSALKEALIELIHERRELFHELFREIIEESDISSLSKSSPVEIPSLKSNSPDEVNGLEAVIEGEIAAFHKLHPELLKKYKGEFVAVHRHTLVDHDADKLALYQRIQDRYPDQFVLMRRVEDEPEKELHLRSTRYSIRAS